ncbi:MAG TPA: hypothetical protein QF353_02275 [Gammaproteobacteria bacterium]|nr:hypothetical protein [Gammaproteobacteria bacterium]
MTHKRHEHFIYQELLLRVSKILIHDERYFLGLCEAINLLSVNRLDETSPYWDDLERVRHFLDRDFRAYEFSINNPEKDEANYRKFLAFCSKTLSTLQSDMRKLSSECIKNRIKEQVRGRLNRHFQQRLLKQRKPPEIGCQSHTEDWLTSMIREQYRFEQGVDYRAVQSVIHSASYESLGQYLHLSSWGLDDFVQMIQSYPDKADDLINCLLEEEDNQERRHVSFWQSLQLGATEVRMLSLLVPSSRLRLLDKIKTIPIKDLVRKGADIEAYCLLFDKDKKKFFQQLDRFFGYKWTFLINSVSELNSLVKHYPIKLFLDRCIEVFVCESSNSSIKKVKDFKRICLILKAYPDFSGVIWEQLHEKMMKCKELSLMMIWLGMFPQRMDYILDQIVSNKVFKKLFKTTQQIKLCGPNLLGNKKVVDYIFTLHGNQRYMKTMDDLEYIFKALDNRVKQKNDSWKKQKKLGVKKYAVHWFKRFVDSPESFKRLSFIVGKKPEYWVPLEEEARQGFLRAMLVDAESCQQLLSLLPQCTRDIQQFMVSKDLIVKVGLSFSETEKVRALLDHEFQASFDARLFETKIMLPRLDTLGKMQYACKNYPGLKKVFWSYASDFLRSRQWKRDDLKQEGLFEKDFFGHSSQSNVVRSLSVLGYFAEKLSLCSSPLTSPKKATSNCSSESNSPRKSMFTLL